MTLFPASYALGVHRFTILFVAYQQSGKSENIDLTDDSLNVVISDASCEIDRVKFTVQTKVRYLTETYRYHYVLSRGSIANKNPFILLHCRRLYPVFKNRNFLSIVSTKNSFGCMIGSKRMKSMPATLYGNTDWDQDHQIFRLFLCLFSSLRYLLHLRDQISTPPVKNCKN